MIVIYTEYDDVSRVLALCAVTLINEAGTLLTKFLAPPSDSNSTGIQQAVQSGEEAVFFFGHGENQTPSLLGQDQMPALGPNNGHFLQNRLVCATCCYSMEALKIAASNHGATVLGYDGELAVPYEQPYASMLQECVLAGPRAFLSGGTVTDAHQAIEDRFSLMAQELTAGPIEDQVVAAFIEDNRVIVDFAGNANRKL